MLHSAREGSLEAHTSKVCFFKEDEEGKSREDLCEKLTFVGKETVLSTLTDLSVGMNEGWKKMP